MCDRASLHGDQTFAATLCEQPASLIGSYATNSQILDGELEQCNNWLQTRFYVEHGGWGGGLVVGYARLETLVH